MGAKRTPSKLGLILGGLLAIVAIATYFFGLAFGGDATIAYTIVAIVLGAIGIGVERISKRRQMDSDCQLNIGSKK